MKPDADRSALDALAVAAIDVDDLARGVEGKVELTSEQEELDLSLMISAVKIAHLAFFENGWRPCPEESQGKFRSPAIEYAVMRKDNLRAEMTATFFLGGISATFEVRSDL